MLELLLNGNAPAAIIFQLPEQILTLGVIVARMLFGKCIPVLVLAEKDFVSLQHYTHAAVEGEDLTVGNELRSIAPAPPSKFNSVFVTKVDLTPRDQALLAGHQGEAARVAMKILLEFAEIQNAKSFIDVAQAHIDACVYTGPASLRFAEYFLATMDAKVSVPTTMNSIAIDQRRWKEIGMDPEHAREADKLANAYTAMGARATFTCAPYLLDTAPKAGQHVGWAESNAVVFANSVLGAHTQKYPDFIDVCIALTGRAPLAGCHVADHRWPTLEIEVPPFDNGFDDSLYPLLGYCIGQLCGPEITLISGLQDKKPSISDLKAFGAAFATTSSAPMFHILGVTPEAYKFLNLKGQLKTVHVTPDDLIHCWKGLNTAKDCSVSMVSLGNPHFSLEEFNALARMCSDGRKRKHDIPLVITTSRYIYDQALKSGLLDILDGYGAEIIADTCWCMLREPVATPGGGNIMTNSGKYAHYAPGLVQRDVHFGSLQECVDASCTGERQPTVPSWLSDAL
jgi:predicted aconitase